MHSLYHQVCCNLRYDLDVSFLVGMNEAKALSVHSTNSPALLELLKLLQSIFFKLTINEKSRCSVKGAVVVINPQKMPTLQFPSALWCV